jgi:hypothetical protein
LKESSGGNGWRKRALRKRRGREVDGEEDEDEAEEHGMLVRGTCSMGDVHYCIVHGVYKY